MAKSTERRGGRKIKYREEGKPVYLALSTPPPLVYLFFHAFHRFFTHHRAPKAGVYQSSLPSFPLYSRARSCKPSLERFWGLWSYEHDPRTRFVAVYFAAGIQCLDVKFTILQSAPRYIIKSLYPLPISTPFPFDRVTRYEATHFCYLSFLFATNYAIRNFLGILLERCYFRLCDLFIFFQVWGFKIRKFKIFPYLGTDDEWERWWKKRKRRLWRPHKGIISIGLDHVPSGPSNLMIIEKRKRPGGVENEGFQKIENGRSVAWI